MFNYSNLLIVFGTIYIRLQVIQYALFLVPIRYIILRIIQLRSAGYIAVIDVNNYVSRGNNCFGIFHF